jgi:PAS domain S-box-containing protein
MTSFLPAPWQSLRWRLPALVTVLMAAVAMTCVWVAYREVEATLVRAGGDRASAAADQVAALFELSTAQSLSTLRLMAAAPDIREYVRHPTDGARDAVRARLAMLAPTSPRRIELWDTAGSRVLEVVTAATGSTIGKLPPQGSRPFAAGVGALHVVDGVTFSDLVAEVPSEPAGSSQAKSTPLGFLLIRGTLSVNPPGALSRLAGKDAAVSVGNQTGGLWTDLTTLVPMPPGDLTRRGVTEYRGAAGESRVGAVSPVRGTYSAVWVDFPRAAVIASAEQFLFRVGGITLALLVMTTGLVTVMSRRITKPLHDVAEAADAIAAGDLDRRTVTSRGDEIGRVSRAFNAMTDQFVAMHQRLADDSRALVQSDARKSAVMAGALDCIVSMDHRGNIVEFNPAAERTFGHSREDAIGQSLADLLIPEAQREQHREGLARYLATGKGAVLGKRIEVSALRKDGSECPVELAIVAIDYDGPPMFTGFMRDLTVQRRAEAARLRSLQIEEENKQVHEANRLKGEFLANMSHELRTPLNSIIGFAELMHKGKVGPVSDTHAEYLGDIVTSSRHLLQLVNDVLDLAKVESGKMDFRPEPVDLSKLVAEVRSILRELAGSKRIRIDTFVDPDVTRVVVDPARVKQILYNYLSNAIKFTPDVGLITVAIRPEGTAFFRIDVTDTGVGIAEEDLSKLFIEFQQLDAGLAKKYQGTGLGLALTRQLAESQGGHVDVRSTIGAGSTFSAVLPRVMSPTSRSASTIPLKAVDTDPGSVPTVLVVDDDPTALKLAEASLTPAGFRVLCADSAEAALSMAAIHHPTAIIVDLLMPSVDGFEFIERFRREKNGADVPIVAWSVMDLNASERDRLQSLAAEVVLKRDGGATTLLTALRRVLSIVPAGPADAE